MITGANLKYAVVADKLCEEIVAHGMQLGDELDSEREIARKYHVAYMTARRAIGKLIDEGILSRRGTTKAIINCLPRFNGKDRNRRTQKYRILVVAPPTTGETLSIITNIARQLIEEDEWQARFLLLPGDAINKETIKSQLANERADGILSICVYSDSILSIIGETGIPHIVIDYPAQVASADSVVTDNRAIAYQIMNHLFEYNHRHIDFIGHRSSEKIDQDALEMETYWNAHIRSRGAEGHSWYSQTGPENAERIVQNIMTENPRPSALFISNLTLARNIKNALFQRGLGVPEDISIISVGWGVGNIGGSDVSLFVVSWFDLVRLALGRLRSRIDGINGALVRIACGGTLDLSGGTTRRL